VQRKLFPNLPRQRYGGHQNLGIPAHSPFISVCFRHSDNEKLDVMMSAAVSWSEECTTRTVAKELVMPKVARIELTDQTLTIAKIIFGRVAAQISGQRIDAALWLEGLAGFKKNQNCFRW
jgi:hypothetical protein